MDLLGPMNISHSWDCVGFALIWVVSELASEERGARACPHCKQKFAESGFSCEHEGQAFIEVVYSIPTTPTQVRHDHDRSFLNIGFISWPTCTLSIEIFGSFLILDQGFHTPAIETDKRN